jgi:hypothetical protein
MGGKGQGHHWASLQMADYFEQATEREIDVEIIPCYSADEAINTFGNLMSSMAIYDNHEECQALMTGFKGRRLVQARGRFQRKDATGACEDVSNIPDEKLLETSQHSYQNGEGSKPTKPCHECGGETVSVGMLTGNWQKLKGQFSGEIFWRLMDDA